MKIAVTVQLSDEQITALRVLSPKLDYAAALVRLVDTASDGVFRPSAWERVWVEQVFGSAWVDRMVQDPHNAWRQVPEAGWLDDDA